jgi:hypothetical protein
VGFLGSNRDEVLDFGLVAYGSMQLVHTQVTSTLKKEAVCSSLKLSKFYYQLFHKTIALKGVLKCTLKQLQHVNGVITIIRERTV